MRLNAYKTFICAAVAMAMTGFWGEEPVANQGSVPSHHSGHALGFDPAELDETTLPGDDFFAYVNGK